MLAVRGQRLPRSFLGVSDLFFGAPADQSQEVLEIASGVGLGLAFSEHGPCFVGGTVTLDDVLFTTSFAIHSGRGCHRGTWALLDTVFPQTFIRRHVLDRMLLVAVDTSYGLEGATLPPVSYTHLTLPTIYSV